MLGSWATANLHKLNEQELVLYEQILNRETLDLFNVLLGRSEVPSEVDNDVMTSILAYVNASPLGKASKAAYASVKTVMSN